MSSSLFAPPSPTAGDTTFLDAKLDERHTQADAWAEDDIQTSAQSPSSLGGAFMDLRSRLRLLDHRVSQTNDVAARAEYARRLASGSVLFRALSIELARDANAYAPISSLPMEIFLMIVKLVSVHEPPHGPSRTMNPGSGSSPLQSVTGVDGSLGWVRLLHVCAEWRSTISRDSALWARHVGTLPKAISTFILRSGMAFPLSIDLDLNAWSHTSNLREIFREIPPRRVKSLILKLNDASDAAWVLRDSHYFRKTQSLSKLENLDIRTFSPLNLEHGATSTIFINTPRLRTLTLDRVPIIPFGPTYLTSVSIRQSPISFAALDKILEQSSAMTSIRLFGCSFEYQQSRSTRRSLESLKLLVLHGCRLRDDDIDHNIYDVFSSHFDFVPSTRLVLFPLIPVRQDPVPLAESRILPAIQMCMRTLLQGNGKEFGFEILPNEIRLVSFAAYEPMDEDWPGTWPDTTICAQIRCDCPTVFTRALAGVLASVDLSRITLLDVRTNEGRAWEHTMSCFSEVRLLRMQSYAYDPLSCLGGCRDGDSRLPLIPQLTHLVIDCVGEHEYTYGILVSTLRSRQTALSQLESAIQTPHTLSLRGFGYLITDGGEEVVPESLRQLVPTVHYIPVLSPDELDAHDRDFFIF